LRVFEIGCGTGGLLAALKPEKGVGVDISEPMIARARAAHPTLDFVVGDTEDPATIAGLPGPFDVIVIADAIGMLDDCQGTFQSLLALCRPDTRLVVAYHNYLWEPVLRLAEIFKLCMPEPLTNWLRPADIANLLELAGFEPVRAEWRQLIPKRLFGIGTLINRVIATLPFICKLCLRHYLVARPRPSGERENLSASVIVPCRNERDNVPAIVARTPQFCDDIEIIFVEGGSGDGTWDEIVRVKAANPGRDIKLFKQDGKGKGDAVRKGFAHARGDVLMILDADMTTAPEELPKFYAPLAARLRRIHQRHAAGLSAGARFDAADQSCRQPPVLAAVQLAAQSTLYRHVLRHQSAPAAALRAHRRGPRLFRRIRPVRRFRPHFRRVETFAQSHRSADPLCRPHLRHDQYLAVPPRLAAVAHGRFRLLEAQSAAVMGRWALRGRAVVAGTHFSAM